MMAARKMMRSLVMRVAVRGQLRWHTAIRLVNTLDATTKPRNDSPRAWHLRQAGRNHR